MERIRTRLSPALRELSILAVLYVVYSAARTLASTDVTQALARAAHLERLERALWFPGERWLNEIATMHDWVGLAADYWYATLHYVVTAGVLVWLYRRGREYYVPARRALVVATVIALGFYLTMPTAPPRMMSGFTDIMALHAESGWWGTSASVPEGLEGLTNELAAFPSMHAGWALWVTLAVFAATRSKVLRALSVVYALGTDVVVVATANHWVIDVVVGQALVLFAWWLTRRRMAALGTAARQPAQPSRVDVEAEAA